MDQRQQRFTVQPGDSSKFIRGQPIVFVGGPPVWWRRLWRYMRRGFRRAQPPITLTVTAVDRESGTIEIG